MTFEDSLVVTDSDKSEADDLEDSPDENDGEDEADNPQQMSMF